MKQNSNRQPLDLEAIRARLAGMEGQRYWRSLEELAETDEFIDLLRREYPRQAAWLGPMSRRSFLKVMGASLALAGLSGCSFSRPRETIVPYVESPDYNVVPGKPLYFATAMTQSGFATGVLAESHLGRPTKIEGNDKHPASLGSSDPYLQASVLQLYDPDRSQTVTYLGRPSTWAAFTAAMQAEAANLQKNQGAGLRILTETITSPTLGAQMAALIKALPQARWHHYEPVGLDNVRAGAQLAFGQYVNTIYRFDRADTIVSLDADFLIGRPGSIRYAREFIDRRRLAAGQKTMNRLYVIEPTVTNTGAMADHRLPLRASEIEGFTRALAQALGVDAGGVTAQGAGGNWIPAIVKDLQQHRGTSIIVAGEAQPPIVHALAHAMNAALGNVGQTVLYTQPVEVEPTDQLASLRELVQDMQSGRVDTLVILGGNPVLTASADFRFSDLLQNNVRLPINLSLYQDETAALCHWHIPETHYLESWSDARAFDGTVSIIQPLIAPLYRNQSAHEMLAVLQGQYSRTSFEIVRDYWNNQQHPADFEAWWREALNDGVIEGTSAPTINVSLQSGFAAQQPPAAPAPGLEIVFKPDPNIWDGRYSNNPWLQEIGKPITSLTWDNAVLLSPTTAQRLHLTNEELVDLRFRGRAVRGPVFIMPGHADDSVTVYLGYGRERAGRVGNTSGFNAYALRASDAAWFGTGLELSKTGEHYSLATVQNHFQLDGRELAREGTLAQYLENPNFLRGEHEEGKNPSLYPEYEYNGYQWGMAIDINACIGCNACAVACYAENNIPVVGKEQVLMGREMNWIRIDTYFSGDLDTPETLFQPRPCMHCEKAPCELVCPTEATVHSGDGLNQMVYNRCIGTRYCSNNCPYKVRRFNFLQYSDLGTPVLKLQRNPDVTVRERGVMEKCTYCIQRINDARINAETENRSIHDGEVMTACQQACPTRAIVFGDINDPNSAVSKLKAQPLNYGMLTELGTQPRTTYLARFRNPNPEIPTG